ncbi:Hypothetical protein PBC10988_19590 [Planctomycetales bacterium 10988]|nr:Hypothetical protein PBC10988_19590 [Planctomycetales bacterium 10988]
MTTLSKVFLVILILLALPFLYLTARTLKTHESWGQMVTQLETQIEDLDKQVALLQTGQRNEDNELVEPGLLQLSKRLDAALGSRGRVFFNVIPRSLDQNGTVALEMQGAEHNIKTGDTFYLFDQKPFYEGGQYFGAFEVTQANPSPDQGLLRLQLSPVSLGIPQLQFVEGNGQSPDQVRIRDSRTVAMDESINSSIDEAYWIMRDVLPPDLYGAFEGLPEETITRQFPPEVAEQYLRQGKPALPSDPQTRVKNGKYFRPLRDYQAGIVDIERDLALLTDEFNARVADLTVQKTRLPEGYEADKEDAAQQIADLDQALENGRKAQAAVQVQLEKVRAELEEVQSETDRVFQECKQLAEEINQLYGKAIDENQVARR